MSRRLIVCVLVLVCLLTGCTDKDKYPVGITLDLQDISVTLPGDFSDLSGESYAEDADFMYGRKTLVVMGLSEKKEGLKVKNLVEYTDSVIRGNNLSCTAVPNGNGYLFTYEKPLDNTTYTYTVATFEGEINFWILQFYCPKENLRENQPEIDIILESLRKKA